jgi:hypothetical protein
MTISSPLRAPRDLLYLLVATTALTPLGYALPALAQGQQAGVSAGVRGEVQLASAGSAAGVVGRQVKSGEAIYLGDRIRSGPSAGMQIMLLDETVLPSAPTARWRSTSSSTIRGRAARWRRG